MKTKYAFLGILLILFASMSALIAKYPVKVHDEVVVIQSKTCGCCKKWNNHLRENGFLVRSIFLEDLAETKEKFKIPQNFRSCHTALAGPYIVEGHVPASEIKKILKERPNVRGISVPGMPIGSPGMEGRYKEPFEVVKF